MQICIENFFYRSIFLRAFLVETQSHQTNELPTQETGTQILWN